MERHTTAGGELPAAARLLAFFAGCAFAAGALMILLGKDLLHPFAWDASQWLTILMVFGTTVAGELMFFAGLKHLGSAIGFLALFLAGTSLVVYSSVGRQVETAGTATLSIEDINATIAEKKADLTSARARKAYAEAQVQKTMTGSYCGRSCKDWKQNAKDVGMAIQQLEADIADLGPQKPVNAQAAAMADFVLLFPIPASKPQIVAFLTLLVPFFKTLFFEIGAIVSFGFAFRPNGKVAKTPDERFSEIKAEALKSIEPSPLVAMFSGELPEPPTPSGPGNPGGGGRKTSQKRFPANVVPITGKHPVERALEINGGAVSSNRELANLLSVSDGEASKSWREIEDRLIVTRSGRNVCLALRA
ncbi:hypothetical protein [Hyphomicrobium sp. DY-1]|uniref:hypothetical protein n=1 Tax=Hyphomicrobium sp. DY-1 TaxID=3075650 RepID=UPI0039C37FCA